MTDRGVSVTLDYVILFAIAAVVLVGVATVSGSMISNQVESGVENELDATGERLAADIQDVERLVNSSDPDETHLSLTSELPNHVSGERYTITVSTEGELVLEASTPGIRVQTPVAADRLAPSNESVPGGTVVITFDTEDHQIEVERA